MTHSILTGILFKLSYYLTLLFFLKRGPFSFKWKRLCQNVNLICKDFFLRKFHLVKKRHVLFWNLQTNPSSLCDPPPSIPHHRHALTPVHEQFPSSCTSTNWHIYCALHVFYPCLQEPDFLFCPLRSLPLLLSSLHICLSAQKSHTKQICLCFICNICTACPFSSVFFNMYKLNK